jgi:hypothetical protein
VPTRQHRTVRPGRHAAGRGSGRCHRLPDGQLKRRSEATDRHSTNSTPPRPRARRLLFTRMVHNVLYGPRLIRDGSEVRGRPREAGGLWCLRRRCAWPERLADREIRCEPPFPIGRPVSGRARRTRRSAACW